MKTAASLILAFACIAAITFGAPPQPGLTITGEVLDVYDGDTLTVEVRQTMKVRVLNAWAPELRDEGGPEAKAHLQQLIGNKPVTVYIPAGSRLGDSLTFGRVLGHVWAGDTSVAEAMIRAGHATKEKR